MILPAVACGVAMFLSSCPTNTNEQPLPAPTDITVVALSTTSLRISWVAPAQSEGCNLYRSDSQSGAYAKINPWLVSVPYYDDTGLSANTHYWYKVVALRNWKEQTLSIACAGRTNQAPLGAPTNMKAAYLTDTSLRVSWDALSGADAYNVYRSSSQYEAYVQVNSTPVGDVFYEDGGLAPGTEYWYMAAGIRDGVEQALSETAEGYTCRRWAKSYGGSSADAARSIQQTTDGGYIVAGYTTSFGAGGSDVWLVKMASDGSVDWQKTYGGSSEDGASSVQQTADGGYIVAGSTDSFGAGGMDAWVLKLTADGMVSWQQSYGWGGDESISAIQPTDDGGYVAAGYCSTNGNDAWVLKLTNDGSVSWQKRYGNMQEDEASSIQQTADGGFIVAGSTFDPVGYRLYDIWLLKLASDGAVTWQKSYDGGGSDYASCVRQTADGGYIVAGKILSQATDSYDQWVLKLDSAGSVVWGKNLGVPEYYGGVYDAAQAVQQTDDGGYLVAGCTKFSYQDYDLILLKLGADGSLTWKRSFSGDGDDVPYSLQKTADGGSVIAGYSTSFDAAGSQWWILKLPQNNELYGASFTSTVSLTCGNYNAGVSTTTASAVETAASVNITSVTGQDSSTEVATQYP
jgi:uncharacterized delta-60 repeat protein